MPASQVKDSSITLPSDSPPSDKTKILRGSKRASYQVEDVNAILDSTFLCHVGFTVDGEARVISTAYVRIENAIYLHGHLHNQMLSALLDGQTACITVTLVDGMVLARSAFHHSVNYRSVVVYGKGELIKEEEKISVLDALIDHYVPGRSQQLRPHTKQELQATLVVKFNIDEASAKIRSGPPVDAEKDYGLDTWAGVLKLQTRVEKVESCPRLNDGIQTPIHVLKFIS